MSEYTFKPLNEVDTVEAPADGTTIMGFQGGVPIQMPMGAVRPRVFVIDISAEDFEAKLEDTEYGNQVKDALLSGKQVWLYNPMYPPTGTSATVDWTTAFSYVSVEYFNILNFGTSGYKLRVFNPMNDMSHYDFSITFDEATA